MDKELREACPANKCHALYDWIRKVRNLQKELALYEKSLDE
jgi:hypothetical protein